MRVTSNTSSNVLLAHLSRLSALQVRLQNQASTGQRLQSVADDPVAAHRVLNLQAESSAVSGFRHSILVERDRSQATFAAVKALKTVSDRAGEIATLADDLKSPQQLAGYAEEVSLLIKQAVALANSQHNGTHLFAGTASQAAPFVLATGADGAPQTVSYQGNASTAQVEVSEGVFLSSQIVGASPAGADAKGLISNGDTGADFFAHLISLRDHLLAGDTAAIANSDTANLQEDEDNFLSHITRVGIVRSRLDSLESRLLSRSEALDTQVTQHAGADLAQTLVELNAASTAYQAALQSSSKVFQMSLMDYIR